MKEIEHIAEDLFNKLRSVYPTLQIGDASASKTLDPEEARFFDFVFEQAGVEIGNVTISLVDDQFKLYYSKDLTEDLGDDKQQWFSFLREMRQFAKRRMLTFDIRDITKSNLERKDFEFLRNQQSEYRDSDMNEGKMYGSIKSSYQDLGETAKIIVRHKRPVDEDVRGSRSRHISKIFIENTAGERVLLPFKNILGARAAARHISEGGQLHDDIGSHITNTVDQMSQLKQFMNYSKRNKLVNEDTQDIFESVVDVYKNIREDLTRMCSSRGYDKFAENFEPVEEILSEENLDEIRDHFTVKKFDESVFESLPLINKIYKTAMENKTNKINQIREFIENGDLVLESSPNSDMVARSVQHSDVRDLVHTVLEDISIRIVDNDIIKEFAYSMMGKELTESEENALAVQLAKKYVSDLGRISEDAEYEQRVRFIETEDTEFVDEAHLVDEWADNIVNKLEESLSAP
tara:strand:+ start:159 stop:1544 length:1386 start_codon:yes stop_codon:yes gene_type:complete